MSGNRIAKPLAWYVKWAIAMVLPTAAMYYLFANTQIHPLIVIAVAIVLCAGLLFLFRLVNLPVTKVEKEALQEQSVLSMLNQILERLETAAKSSKNSRVDDEMKKMLTKARVFILLLAGDNLNSVDLAEGVLDHVRTLEAQLTECNRLSSGPDDGIYDVIISTIHEISQTLETMTTDYKEGRMEDVKVSLTSLSRKLVMRGYIRPTNQL